MACVTRSGKCYQTPDERKTEAMHHTVKSGAKSARKRLVLIGETKTELEESTLIEEDVLEKIFELSPLSSIKRSKESIKPGQASCKVLLSPLRDLGLTTPNKVYATNSVEQKQCKDTVSKLTSSGECVKKGPSPSKCSFVQTEVPEQETPKKKSATIETPSKRKTTTKASNYSSSPPKKSKIRNANDGNSSFSLDKTSPRKHLAPKNKLLFQVAVKNESKEAKSPPRAVLGSISNTMHSPGINVAEQPSSKACRQERSAGAFIKVKNALHNSVPHTLVGRDAEMQEIISFIENCVKSKNSSSLYISGAPGTGKSACLMNILSQEKVQKSVQKIVAINCMSICSAASVYQRVATEMGATVQQSKSARSALKYVEQKVTSAGPNLLLVLDEIDQLDSKHQDVLYSMFGWTTLPKSRIILIGIANSLDLTDRILPRLQANVDCKPKLLNFRPYNKDQLVCILQDRVRNASSQDDSESNVIDPMAIQFCARKIAAVAGDARKALDVCRRAVELVENTRRKSSSEGNKPAKVGVMQISNILQGVYDSSNMGKRQSSAAGDCHNDDVFPLQQKLAICTLLLLCRATKCKEATIGKLHEAYSAVCKKRQVSSVSQSEFISLCELVEARGILSVRKSKQIRQSKVKLNMQEKDVEFALQGKALLSSILQDGLSSL